MKTEPKIVKLSRVTLLAPAEIGGRVSRTFIVGDATVNALELIDDRVYIDVKNGTTVILPWSTIQTATVAV